MMKRKKIVLFFNIKNIQNLNYSFIKYKGNIEKQPNDAKKRSEERRVGKECS